MKKSLLILLCLIPLAVACIYDYEAGTEENASFVVIEGDIIVGDYTRLSLTKDNDKKTVWYKAVVEGEDGSKSEEARSVDGYCTVDTRALDPSVRYRLRIEDLKTGEHYTSSWESVQPAPVIDSLSYSIHDDIMDLRATFHADAGTPYYALGVNDTWEYRSYATSYFRYVEPGGTAPEGGREVFPEPETGMIYIYGSIFHVDYPQPNNTCWASSGMGQMQALTTGAMVSNKMVDYTFKTLTREDPRLSVKYHLTVSLRMISQGSYTYWDAMDKVSSLTGDLFSPTPSLQRGNIINEEHPDALVLGYIGASVWTTDELWIDANDVLFYQEPHSIQEMLEKEALGLVEPFGVPMNRMMGYYGQGYRPWYRVSPESGGTTSETYYVWITERCLDCRTQGGSVYKPENWPE